MGRTHVGDGRVLRFVEGDLFPGVFLTDQLTQQAIVEGVTRFMTAEGTDQAVSQQIEVADGVEVLCLTNSSS